MAPALPTMPRTWLLLMVAVLGCGQANAPPGKPATSATPQDEFPIKLIRGVAQVHYGGDTPLMTFGVPYDFRAEHAPDPAAKYIWMIQPARAQPIEKQVQLVDSASLETATPDLRPEDGPFTTYLDAEAPDGSRTRVSNTVPLE